MWTFISWQNIKSLFFFFFLAQGLFNNLCERECSTFKNASCVCYFCFGNSNFKSSTNSVEMLKYLQNLHVVWWDEHGLHGLLIFAQSSALPLCRSLTGLLICWGENTVNRCWCSGTFWQRSLQLSSACPSLVWVFIACGFFSLSYSCMWHILCFPVEAVSLPSDFPHKTHFLNVLQWITVFMGSWPLSKLVKRAKKATFPAGESLNDAWGCSPQILVPFVFLVSCLSVEIAGHSWWQKNPRYTQFPDPTEEYRCLFAVDHQMCWCHYFG